MDLAPELSGVTPVEMRSTLSRFATGVVVLTVGGEHVHGMTANAFTSVSLEPPLVLCCVARTAAMHRAITSAGHYAISVLNADQEHCARHFADRRRPEGRAQFDAVDWLPGRSTGAPVLTDALAWVECALEEAHEAGDHSVFIGRVLGAGREESGAGLLFFDGNYGKAPAQAGR